MNAPGLVGYHPGDDFVRFNGDWSKTAILRQNWSYNDTYGWAELTFKSKIHTQKENPNQGTDSFFVNIRAPGFGTPLVSTIATLTQADASPSWVARGPYPVYGLASATDYDFILEFAGVTNSESDTTTFYIQDASITLYTWEELEILWNGK